MKLPLLYSLVFVKNGDKSQPLHVDADGAGARLQAINRIVSFSVSCAELASYAYRPYG